VDRFGISAAIERAKQAIEAGMVRDDDGMAFAEWLTDEYRDEERSYVDGVPTTTLYGRFLAAR